MRLWSLHPKYLDRQGLIALWRETLLAQKVLAGNTRGYKNHPQLLRFKSTKDPLLFIGTYLKSLVGEAERRGYQFDSTKILKSSLKKKNIPVTLGQMDYEREHLLRKLKIRDPKLYRLWKNEKRLSPHPLFRTIKGEVEDWERV